MQFAVPAGHPVNGIIQQHRWHLAEDDADRTAGVLQGASSVHVILIVTVCACNTDSQSMCM